MTELIKCPQCRATNPQDAQWCGQCFTAFTSGAAGEAASAPEPEVAIPEPVRSGWECKTCGHDNAVELSACEACGTPIYDSYGKDSEEDHDPEAALRRALIFPGFGYGSIGLAPIGVVAGFLAIASLIVGVMLLVAGELLGLMLLVVFLAIWAASVLDVIRLTSGESRMLLSPRVLSVAGGLVVALLLLSVLVAFQAATS